MVVRDFHISKQARIKYDFKGEFYSLNGNLIITSSQNARIISDRINEVRKKEGEYGKLTTAGEVNALGLLHEIYHFLITHYAENENPGVFKRGLDHLSSTLNKDKVDKVLSDFIDEFPPIPVFKDKIKKQDYLNGKTNNKPNKEILLEELIILHFENSNPAASKLNELFSDRFLRENSPYTQLINSTKEFFDQEKETGFGGLHLFAMLLKPIITNPFNLEAQLNFIRNEWGFKIDSELLNKLLRGTDLIREDYKLFIKHGGGEKATPPVPDYKFDPLYSGDFGDSSIKQLEGELFSTDVDWMPEVVMIAKNIFVWLHQLSEKYQRYISRLDEIPDEELNLLADWNFTALWLIGIWERCTASRRIKQLTGNPEAAASAYSLFDYVIAEELGGEDAFNNLKYRAALRGIRIASDMVPNHSGIFSKWVIEKPDYFIQTSTPPYYSYSFTGENLSPDDRIEIRIEDKYYSREDAAVVFERIDRYTGERRYIYHGNDGTNMPWNDTAQLNLLNPELRESLYQTIKHVAQKTPIIRFDAAMTLTHKHYQRLWYPEPGKGGDIPSRSDYSMAREEFYKQIPTEFWREVVDRLKAELPNTLLLAEAFWLMEGYFVRSLGMHRVYNSAFMHMLMKEENDKYRKLIKNTLEFNPEILKRYVNFMSNPDEETAVNQFGKGDKYFGVAVMMVTLPGLPMFGHGQIEGFSEKYGMEYKRAYYNETVDEHLVWRHKREIFPLLKKRHLFSQVNNFELYDFIDLNGHLNENIFVYSNKADYESALVIYNNSYDTVEGRIKYSNPKLANNTYLPSKDLSAVFNFNPDYKFYYVYTDHRTQLQFLSSGKEVNDEGFKIKLFGYQYRICLNFREVYDETGEYKQLYNYLNGRGVVSIEDALHEQQMIPLHSALEEFLSPPNIRKIRNYLFQSGRKETVKERRKKDEEISSEINEGLIILRNELDNYNYSFPQFEIISESFYNSLKAGNSFYELWNRHISRKVVPQWMTDANDLLPVKKENIDNSTVCLFTVFTTINTVLSSDLADATTKFDKLLLAKPITDTLNHHCNEDDSRVNASLIKALLVFYLEINELKIKMKKKKAKKTRGILQNLSFSELLFNNNVSSYLLVNKFNEITYFNKERFELLIRWLYLLTVLQSYTYYEKALIKSKEKKGNSKIKIAKQELDRELVNSVKNGYLSANRIMWLAEEAGYDLVKFNNSLIQVNRKSKNNTKEREK
jgi:glycosidase